MSDQQNSTPPEKQPTATEHETTTVPDWKTRYRESAGAFRETRDKLNARIATLKGQLAALRERNSTLIEQRDTFKMRNVALKNQQSELRDRIKELAADQPSNARTADFGHSEIETVNGGSAVHRLQAHIADLRRQVSDARRLANRLTAEVRRQGGNIDVAATKVDLSSVCASAADHEAVGQLTTQLSEERKRANERQQTLKDRLQTARELAETRRLTASEEVTARKQAEKDRDRAWAESAQARERQASLESALDDARAKFSQQLEESHSALELVQKELAEERKSHNAAIEDLTVTTDTKIQRFQEQVESLRSSLTDARHASRDQIEKLQAQVIATRKALAAETKKAQELSQEIAEHLDAQTELEEAKAVVAGLRSQAKLKQDALQAARESYEGRVASLRGKLEEVRRSNSEQISQLRKCEAESHSKSEAIAAIRKELQKEKQGHQKSQAEHESSLCNVNRQLARALSNLDSNRAQVDELKIKINEVRQHGNETIERLREQVAEEKKSSAETAILRRDLESNKTMIAELEKSNVEQNETYEAHRRDHEKTTELLHEKLTAARAQTKESTQRLRTVQAQNTELREELRTVTARADDYQVLEDQLSKLKETVEHRTAEMQSAIVEKDTVAATADNLQAQLKDVRGKLEGEREAFEQEKSNIKSERDSAKADLEKTESRLQQLEQEMRANDQATMGSEELEMQLKAAQEENDRLHERLESEQKKSQSAQDEFKTALQNAQNDRKAALQEVRDDYNRRLQSMRDDHNGTLQTLREKLAETRQDRNERVKELQAELRETKRQLGTIDSRDIDPREHNTPEAMDSFFAEAAEVERYEEFGESLQNALKSHRVTLNKKIVMDAGVGPGYALAEMLKRYRPAEVHGIDYSTVAIEKCRELMPNGTFTVGSLYEPLPGNYDVVLCTEVLEHLDDPETAVRQILSALLPGGTAVFTVPDGRVDVSRLHLNFWSPESWKRFIDQAARGHRITTGSFQARESSRYQNNLAIVRASSGHPASATKLQKGR